VQPESANAAAHDAMSRFLHRLEPTTEQLWSEAQPQEQLQQGILVVDDSTLDKWYAETMALVTRHSQRLWLRQSLQDRCSKR
jgi:putative transposase